MMRTFRSVAGGTALSATTLLGTTAIVHALPTVDGVVNPGEYQTSQSVTLQVTGGTPNPFNATGTLYLSVDPGTGNVFFAVVQPISINDNVYGTTATNAFNWGSKGHTLNPDLLGSDEASFSVTDGKGNTVFTFAQDYIGTTTVSATYPSGFASCGADGKTNNGATCSNSDGKVTTGAASDLTAFATSLDYDLNTAAGNTNFNTNSPTPSGSTETGTVPGTGPSNWVYNIEYEGEIAASTFNGNGLGGLTLTLVHDSPNKQGGSPPVDCVANCTITPGTPGVPEPSTLTLLGAGLASFYLFKRGRRRSVEPPLGAEPTVHV